MFVAVYIRKESCGFQTVSCNLQWKLNVIAQRHQLETWNKIIRIVIYLLSPSRGSKGCWTVVAQAELLARPNG